MTQTALYLNVNHSRLHVHRWKPATAKGETPVVLLHDALGSIPQWRGFPEMLAEKVRREVVAYERKGHGLSSPLTGKREKDYLHREALEDLPVLLEALRLENPILIGHSDGGTIALIHAAHFRPKRIVTLAAHVIVEEVTLAGIHTALRRRDWLIERLEQYHGDKAEALFDAWADTWLDPAFGNWDITGLLPDISCPALIIQGQNDEYGTSEQVRLIQKGVGDPAESLMLKNCGHAPHLERMEEVCGAINNFLEG